MKNGALIDEAVRRAQAERPVLDEGEVAVHPSEELSATFLRYEGDRAWLRWPEGRESSFPRSEVVNPNRVLSIAARLKFGIGFDS